MKKFVKFLLFLLLAIVVILMIIPLNIIPLDDLSHTTETALIISEFDLPLWWRHGEVDVAKISPEELNQYPILKNLTNGDCTKYVNQWYCKVNPAEWNRTKNFIDKKENVETCINIGEKCYRIDFVTCCARDVEITNIFLGRCACPPPVYQRHGKNNEIGLILTITVQNNQSIDTGMLTYNVKIRNSSNIVVSNYSSEVPVYIKNNSSIGITTTGSFPGPGDYNVEVQVLEQDKVIAQRSINKTVEAFSNIGNKLPILNEEYEIYSVIIPQKHENESKFIDKFVIRQSTYNYTSDGILDSYGFNNLENFTGKKLDIDLVKNFKIKNVDKSILENKFSIPQRVILISEEEFNYIFGVTKGWDSFYEIYPNSSGVIEISRVGFNNNSTQALVYYGEQSHWLAGNGYFIYLLKEEGKWTIKYQVMLWVS